MFRRRLGYLMTGWGSVGLAYAIGWHFTARAVTIPVLALDRAIPFRPEAIGIYLSFFLFVPWTFLAVRARRLPWLMLSMQMSAVAAGFAFMLCPTTVGVPPAGASEALTRLAAFDTHVNCLPSLHGALSVLCAMALLDARRPVLAIVSLAWAALICWSTLALRRHLALDLGAGMLLGMVSGTVLMPRHHREW